MGVIPMKEHMKYFKRILLPLIILITFSVSASAGRDWIGETQLERIKFAKSDGGCGPNGGACMQLIFKDGFKGCKSVSIRETDEHFKHIESMALISLTAGKALRVYGSNQSCRDADNISINDVELY